MFQYSFPQISLQSMMICQTYHCCHIFLAGLRKVFGCRRRFLADLPRSTEVNEVLDILEQSKAPVSL